MRRWRARRSPGFWAGLSVLVVLVLLAGAAGLQLWRTLEADPESWHLGIGTFGLIAGLVGCLALAALLIYWLGSAWSMSYSLDRNAVFISWLGNRYVIPLDRIESVDFGVDGARLSWFGLRPFGYRRGEGQLADGRPLSLFITAPLQRALVIYTADAAYALSPVAEREFIQEIEQHRGLGVVQPRTPGIERSRHFNYGFWLDSTVLKLIFSAFTLNLLLWAVLTWRYEHLPDLLVLRLDAVGGHLQPKHQLLLLPLGAFGLLLFNLFLGLRLYLRERGAVLLLQSTSIIVHVVVLAALLNLVR
ncbi:MAG: hypothetical protein KatS3mg057_0844 [Herpetosiphonaceae bacterium]|nr:MAG: hypothetical protein KatS3mg057_0844 [Herpetosiphonaceae bacterium]